MKHIPSDKTIPSSKKETIALIPARYGSTRFPGKLMKTLGNTTVIVQTYRAVVRTGLFKEVVVVTDSPLIYREVISHKGRALMSEKEHTCGTDRIAHAMDHFPQAELIVNVQGDEPFTRAEPLKALLKAMMKGSVDVASLMTSITSREEIDNRNVVKVVTDKEGYATLFSRASLPSKAFCFRHIGVYAFRRQALLRFASLPPGPLELNEKLENLRFLENGMKIKMVKVAGYPKGIDTPEDLHNARKMLHLL